MCNRARLSHEPETLRTHFGADWLAERPMDNRFNPRELTPRSRAYVIRRSDRGVGVDVMSWDVLGGQAKWPMTNVRNLSLPQWRRLAEKPENRCLVPLSEFCEWTPDVHDVGGGKPIKGEMWFQVIDQPLFAVAGFWQPSAKGNGFTMVTCDPNALVEPIHPKAMITILEPDDHERWLNGSYDDVVTLQRPFDAARMTVRGPEFPTRRSALTRWASTRNLPPDVPSHIGCCKSDTWAGHILIGDLKAARRSAGLTQEALAARIGVDAQTVKRLEKGVGSVATLVTVMEALEYRLVGLGIGANLGDQLRSRRLRRAMSITEVASRTGISRGTVAGLERGGGSVASLLRLLEVVAPKVRRRAPERSYWGQTDKQDRDSRFTPADFMDNVYAAFGKVDLDPCGHVLSPVVARRRVLLSEGGDGLVDDWTGRLAFVNPPFSELLKWLRRAHDQWRAGNVDTVICLVPVRTESAWFHQTLSADADLYLLQGRVRFLSPAGKAQPTPFSLMLVALGASAEQRNRFSELVPGIWLARSAPHQQQQPRRDDHAVTGRTPPAPRRSASSTPATARRRASSTRA